MIGFYILAFAAFFVGIALIFSIFVLGIEEAEWRPAKLLLLVSIGLCIALVIAYHLGI